MIYFIILTIVMIYCYNQRLFNLTKDNVFSGHNEKREPTTFYGVNFN